MRVETIIGSRTDAALEDIFHRVEHLGGVEFVTVLPNDLDRRRLKLRTDRNEELAITLPRSQKLFDGAVLHLSDTRAIVVRAGDQRWLRVSPRTAIDALELGYYAGNLHWKVRFDGGDLLVALEGPEQDYAARITPLIEAGRVTLEVEAT
jgi:urease accessory protein